jgi:hypothetical protein
MTAGHDSGVDLLCGHPRRRHRLGTVFQTNNGLLLAADDELTLLAGTDNVRCTRCRRMCVIDAVNLQREIRGSRRAEYVAPFA